jgi:hypothetical protein
MMFDLFRNDDKKNDRMKNRMVSFLWVLTLFLTVFAPHLAAQPGTISAFSIGSSAIELSRLAQPNAPFDKVGRKFAILGFESGTFEAWAYPLKLFRNFEISFLIQSSTEPIRGKDIVRTVTARPEATTLTYTFQSFTVRAHVITPVDEPGAFVLLDVNSTEPLTIICSFLPVLQPMWPAGLGGQYAYWDAKTNAYLISEPTRGSHAYLGSPSAAGMSYTPAHMLSDHPNQFKIEIPSPDSVRHRFIPIIMAGGKGAREAVKASYQRLVEDPEGMYRKTVAYYDSLRFATLTIQTPVHELNLAFEWAKISYDNLFVDNPDLGLGMIAGLGSSGTSGRPGFGWFFGGDAFINSLSLNSLGAFRSTRNSLAFTQRWQRGDGKMAHELSQAAGFVQWWKDYPYGYIHGDTSPWYVCAIADYFSATGDTTFLRSSWSSIRRAYQWSLATDENGDGLMDNKKAGLGALEYGPLTDIQSDVYTSAVWVRAASSIVPLARVIGERAFADSADEYAARARRSFNERFWDAEKSQYAYAFTATGKRVDIVSPWNSVGLMWQLGEKERSERSLEQLNSAELTTDWGVRSISNKSSYYEALNYNYGAVWPFLTSWVASAQYAHHFSLQGFASLMASVRHTFDNQLGAVTEVFSGTHNVWPQEAVSHQGFCTAGVVLPLVRGLLGMEADVPTGTISLKPQFPADWSEVSASQWNVGRAFLRWTYSRSIDRVRLTLDAENPQSQRFLFAPAFGIGTRIINVQVDGQTIPFSQETTTRTIQPNITFSLQQHQTVEILFEPAVEILPSVTDTKTGDSNKGLKIISYSFSAKNLVVIVEGLSSNAYELRVANAGRIQSVTGAVREGSALRFSMPNGPVGEFVRHTLKICTL